MTVTPALLAGAATVDITPAGSVFLFGYPHARRHSTGVHDPLQCTALCLRRPDAGALLLALDVIFFSAAFVHEIRRRIRAACGVPEEAIMISATHTHSGPVVADQLSNAADSAVPRADPHYLEWLAGRMVEAATTAWRRAEPAEIGLTVARATGVGTNRHDPAGLTDADVFVLVARAVATGRPIAAVLVYGMHPTILHEDSTLISADFPHFAREWIRAHALPSCPVLYLQGASGNQSPRHTVRANTFAEAQRLGELLGRTVVAAIPSIAYQRNAAIRTSRRTVELEPRRFPSIAEADREVAETRTRFENLRTSGASRQTVRTAECDVFGAEETAELARAAGNGRLHAAITACQPAEIQLLQIGPWNFVAWPGEFFVEHGLALKAQAPGTILVTLANGELQGYIATDAAAQAGHYESRNAVFAPANGRRFVDASLALLRANS